MTRRGFDHPAAADLEATLADALADGPTPGEHVAIVSDPFAGREALCDAAASLLDEPVHTRLQATADTPAAVPEAADGTAVVVENCQYLFTRRIGGFDTLAAFTDRLATGDAQFVTTWNRYAWSYLAGVENVDDLFSVVVDVPPLDADGIEALVDDDGVRFEAAAPDESRAAATHLPLPGGRTLSVPKPGGDGGRLQIRRERDPRAAVVRALVRHSNGSPGAAQALWERAATDGVVSPGAVRDAAPSVDLDDEAAFALQVVLSNGQVDRTTLREVVGPRLFDRSLRELRRQDVVTVDGDTVALRPVALAGAVSFLDGRRLLW